MVEEVNVLEAEPRPDLADLWIDLYVASHQHFGITTDQDVLESRLGSFVREALLATIPHVTAGPLTPMELLVLSQDSH